MFSICFKPNYTFCSCFELFILVGLQQTIGYHLLCVFSLVMLICIVDVLYVLAQPFLFGHMQSSFLKNEVIL